MRHWAVIGAVGSMLAAGCGPNVLSAKATVMNPLVRDSKELAYMRVAVIVRKETRARPEHTIVGAYHRPAALGELHEPAEIPKQLTDGSGLYFDVGPIYSDIKEELVEFPNKFEFWLVADGKRIDCSVHRSDRIRDLSEQVSGGSMQTHQVVRDKRSGTVRAYRHWEEVTNDMTLYSKKARLLCRSSEPFLNMATRSLTLHVLGWQRERRYRFDLVTDPETLMRLERDGD